jgi:hypothetical protein
VPRILLSIFLRSAFWLAVAWYASQKIGLIAFAVTAPLLGALLARPILDFIEESHYTGKSAALAGVQGRWWMHRGRRIDIAEDADRLRWLLTSDVRKVLRGLPRDEVLGKQFGDRAGVVEDEPGFRIRADALADYLRKSHDGASLKFKVWLDREVLGGERNPRSR